MKKRVQLRAPHSRIRNVLTAPSKEGFVRRFVKEDDIRFAQLEGWGWKRVDDSNVQVGDKLVANNNQALGTGARRPDGSGGHLILMEIPKDLYDAAQAEKQEQTSASEEEINRNLKHVPNVTQQVEIVRSK